jgi:predicted nucleic acid-binding protein
MGLILDEIPEGVSVLIDTNPIIYYLENHPALAARYQPLFTAAAQGRNELVISTITLAEVLGGPARTNNEVLLERYEQELSSNSSWRIREVDSAIAVQAARLRARYRLKLPDAIQLATALSEGCYALVTHDRDFTAVTELPIIK